MRRQLIICLVLAGITLGIYWPAGGFDRVFYDDPEFLDSPEVQSGINGHSFLWAMTMPVAANWHPVTTLSFILTHECFGNNAGAEHVVNVVIHALNAVLLFLVLQRLMGGTAREDSRPTGGLNSTLGTPETGWKRCPTTMWLCAIVAALFAWHPLRVESVAWIAERKDVLCAFFMLLAFWEYANYSQATQKRKAESGKRNDPVRSAECGMRKSEGIISGLLPPANIHYWLALIFFALGLLSKAMVVTLPFLLVLLDIWPLRRIELAAFRIKWFFPKRPSSTLRAPSPAPTGEGQAECRNSPRASMAFSGKEWRHSAEMPLRLIVEKWPFFLLSILFCLVTFLVQRSSDATPSLQQLGLGIRLENVIVSYWRYLGWSVWPNKLAAYYTFPYDSQTYHFYLALWPGWGIAAAVLALVAVSVLVLTQLARRPYLAVGWFWYLGTMVPVIGFVQVGSQGMADRYTYIPMIGPVISVVWLIFEKWGSRVLARPLLAIVTLVILTASVFQTRHQLQYWQNSNVLFQHTIDVTGENPRAEYILGLDFENKGNIAQAMVHYRNAITSQPRVKEAFYAMARLLGQQGEWTKAAQVYATLLGDNTNDFAANLGLATTLPQLGRTADAVLHLKTAEEHCPDNPQALNNLAWALATSDPADLRDGAQAVKYGERACQLTGYRETIMVGTLGAAYAEAGRFEDAIATAQKACDLASAAGNTYLLKNNQQLLELYRQHRPYRE